MTNKKTYQCNHCVHKAFKYSNLLRHLKLHIDPPVFHCNLCEKDFSTKYNLSRHIKLCDQLNPSDRRFGKNKVKRLNPKPAKNTSLRLTVPVRECWDLMGPGPWIRHRQDPPLSLNLSDSESDSTTIESDKLVRLRRSIRKTPSEIQKAIVNQLKKDNDMGLDIMEEDYLEKGRGVKSTKDFEQGDFILEYSGELIDSENADYRETQYSMDVSKGCYMYYFKHKVGGVIIVYKKEKEVFNIQFCITGKAVLH